MTDAPKRIWEFDRYINGVLMAEGVTVEKQPDIASAMKAAAIIASRGPHGEVPVLIVREGASEHAALIREAEARGMERAANIAVADAKQLTEEALQWRADNRRDRQRGERRGAMTPAELTARGVRVRKLEWEDLGAKGNFSRAKSPLFGTIRVDNYGDCFTVAYSVPGFSGTFTPGEFPSIEAAKAAAQADYEARICAALTTGENDD